MTLEELVKQELGSASTRITKLESRFELLFEQAEEILRFVEKSEKSTLGTPTLNAALAEAAQLFPKIEKTKTAKVMKDGRLLYEFDYADLADIEAAVRGPLGKHSLAIVHQVSPNEKGGLLLRTSLRHSSGETLESSMLLPGNTARPQDLGGLLTFYKRYLLSALLGVSSDSDDDGNGASGNDAKISNKEKAGPKPGPSGPPSSKPMPANDLDRALRAGPAVTNPKMPEPPPFDENEQFANSPDPSFDDPPGTILDHLDKAPADPQHALQADRAVAEKTAPVGKISLRDLAQSKGYTSETLNFLVKKFTSKVGYSKLTITEEQFIRGLVEKTPAEKVLADMKAGA